MPSNSIHAYIEGMYAPVKDELDAVLVLTGERPDCVGSFAQNNPNPYYPPEGMYHWFDGDGMIHGVHLDGASARYKNRYIQTRGLREEQLAGHPLWKGILEPIQTGNRAPDKDTANTDLIFHNNQLLATWWLSGQPYAIDPKTFETIGPETFKGTLKENIAAHPKCDPKTGELICFSYNPYSPPYLQSCVISRTGEVTHRSLIECPLPSLFHDIAITENHTVFMDLPLIWDPKAIAESKRKVRFHRNRPSRFGVMPRHDDGTNIQWFELPPCYIYHTINTWEEVNELGQTVIVMNACRIENPLPQCSHSEEPQIPRLFFLRLHPFLTEFRFNLSTGEARECQLDDRPTEFPRLNDNFLGQKSRYSYHPRIAKEPTLLFDGFIKYDLQTGGSVEISYGPNCFGSETVFAPRNNSTAEDDGYVIMYVSNRREDWTELRFYNASDPQKEPVGSYRLPRRVPTGFHAEWASL